MTAKMRDVIRREILRLNDPFETVDHALQFDESDAVQYGQVSFLIDDSKVGLMDKFRLRESDQSRAKVRKSYIF